MCADLMDKSRMYTRAIAISESFMNISTGGGADEDLKDLER
jgi:hypothetical protein